MPGTSVIPSLRIISGCELVGTVTAGALFGWMAPAWGLIGAHEVGAVLGAGFGIYAAARHLI